MRIVVSVEQWSELVRTVAGACATVTTIVSGTTGDPHDYEPTPAAMDSLGSARIVVVNGLGYDEWAAKAVSSSSPHPAVVDAGAAAGKVPGDNPHVWYSPTLVGRVADAVTAQLSAVLGPAAAGYLTAQRASWQRAMTPLTALVAALAPVVSGRRAAATESVYAYALNDLGIVDVTPAGYRQATVNESEPAPADVQGFEELLRHGGADLLVFNTQTQGAVPAQVRSTAEHQHIPVLEVTETLPATATRSFVAWQLDDLTRLGHLLARS